MLTVALPEMLETRLEGAAKAVGRTKEEIVLVAINEQLMDIEDALISHERINDPNAEFVSLEEVMSSLGLNDKPEPQA